MTEKLNDGGPAFPHQLLGSNGMPWDKGVHGMSLRDWFAGQALPGVLDICRSDTEAGPQHFANMTYAIADAMLKARGEANG